MNRVRDILLKSAWVLTILLLVGAPLHAFVSTWLLSGGGLKDFGLISFFVQAWKELVILLLLLIACLVRLVSPQKVIALEFGIIGFILVGITVTLTNWSSLTIGHLIWGGRTEFGFLLLLLAMVTFARFWQKDQLSLLLKIVLVEGAVIVGFGFILQLFGHELLTNFGYRNDWSTFYVNQSPAFCQKESGTEFCRWQSFFAGPNRYAAYLLTLLPVVFFVLKSGWKRSLMLVAVGVSLIATLSSSAWLGAIIAFVGCYFAGNFSTVKKWFGFKWLWVALAVSLSLLCLFAVPLIVQKATNVEHFIRMWMAFKAFLLDPFGSGLGVSGPASYKLGVSLIPESWFLQVLVNTGIFGFAVFLLIWLEAFRDIWKNFFVKKNVVPITKVAGFVLLALLVQNLFLHTLEDASVYVGGMILVAMSYASNSLKELNL